jgi:hypothetical protein
MTIMNQLRMWKAVRRRFLTMRVHTASCSELRNLTDRILQDIGAARPIRHTPRFSSGSRASSEAAASIKYIQGSNGISWATDLGCQNAGIAQKVEQGLSRAKMMVELHLPAPIAAMQLSVFEPLRCRKRPLRGGLSLSPVRHRAVDNKNNEGADRAK